VTVADGMASVDRSLVYECYYFLRDFGRQTSKQTREGFIQLMNPEMMEALKIVVDCIVYGWIIVSRIDYGEFRHRMDDLRQIFSALISFARKKRTLVRLRKLLPRLLCERYIRSTIRVEQQRNTLQAES
jgi:hypothetical protein